MTSDTAVSVAKERWDKFCSRHLCSGCCVRGSDSSEIDTTACTQYVHDENAVPPQMKHALVFQADGADKELVERAEVVVEGSARYRGQWKGIYFHGNGTLLRPDGSWYEGQFDQGRAHGQGKFVAQNGNSYEGQWFQDGAHGFGRYAFEDGSIYEGEWRGDEKSGEGMERWVDGSHYIGQFLKGHKHGFGFYTSSNGDPLFRGQFQADKMDGDGTYYFANGRSYSGQWKDGHMNGNGTMQWPDGSKYKGGYKDDLRHGEGALTWPDGRTYSGQWCKGKQEGRGFVVEANGTRRASAWRGGVEVVDELGHPLGVDVPQTVAPTSMLAESMPERSEPSAASPTAPRAQAPQGSGLPPSLGAASQLEAACEIQPSEALSTSPVYAAPKHENLAGGAQAGDQDRTTATEATPANDPEAVACRTDGAAKAATSDVKVAGDSRGARGVIDWKGSTETMPESRG